MTEYLTEVTWEVAEGSIMVVVVRGDGRKGSRSCSLGFTIPGSQLWPGNAQVGLRRLIPRWFPSLCSILAPLEMTVAWGLTGVIFEPSASLANTGSHVSRQV